MQLEEPFSILPLEALCADVRDAAADMVEGMPSARTPLAPRARRRATDAKMLAPTDVGDAMLLAALSPVEQGERYFLAGGLCASISHALACPIDVVKTRQHGMCQYRRPSSLAAAAPATCSLKRPPACVRRPIGSRAELRQSGHRGASQGASPRRRPNRWFRHASPSRQQTVPRYRELSLQEGLQRVTTDDGPAALFTGVVPTIVGYGAEGALKFGAYVGRVDSDVSLAPQLATLATSSGPTRLLVAPRTRGLNC